MRHAIPLLRQSWLFATPVAYPSTLVPERWALWAQLGKATPPGPMLTVLIIAVVALVIDGLMYFRTTQATFADIV